MLLYDILKCANEFAHSGHYIFAKSIRMLGGAKIAYRKMKTCQSCGHLFYIFCWHRHAQLDPKDLQTSDR